MFAVLATDSLGSEMSQVVKEVGYSESENLSSSNYQFCDVGTLQLKQ